MNESRSLHLLGALGLPHTEMIGGREHLVVPVVAMIEGVVHAVNASTPEFVPVDTLQKAAASWNGKPVTLGHPKKNGAQCSANDPGVLASHGIATIRNSRVVGKKMLMEALIEKGKAKQLHPDLYQFLAHGGTEEVSIGAMVVTDRQSGTHGGRPFVGTWTMAEGDHLAVLPAGLGACSVASGCGTHRAAMRVCAESLVLDTLEGRRHSTADQAHIDTAAAHLTSALDRLHSAGARVPGTSQMTEADIEQGERAAASYAPPNAYAKALSARALSEQRGGETTHDERARQEAEYRGRREEEFAAEYARHDAKEWR